MKGAGWPQKRRILETVTGLAIYTCMERLCTPRAVVEAHRPMVKPKLESGQYFEGEEEQSN